MKSMRYLSMALFVVSFSVCSIHAADINFPQSAWTPALSTPGLTIQQVRTAGGTSTDYRAFVKIIGYNEVEIADFTSAVGKQLYASALSAMTSGTKVSVYVTSGAWGGGMLTGISLSGY